MRADPDGYTLLQCAAYNVVNSALYKNLNFSFVRDVVPVAIMITVPLVLVAGGGDRAIAPHDANLFDMQQKYAAVMTLEEALQTPSKNWK